MVIISSYILFFINFSSLDLLGFEGAFIEACATRYLISLTSHLGQF